MSARGKGGALQLRAPGRPPAPGLVARFGRNPQVFCIGREPEQLRKSAVKQAPPLPVYTTAANATTTAAASLSAATITTSSPSHRRVRYFHHKDALTLPTRSGFPHPTLQAQSSGEGKAASFT